MIDSIQSNVFRRAFDCVELITLSFFKYTIMSNEYQEDSELFESEDSPEENSDDASTTNIEKNGEESNDDKSQEAKDRQVDSATKKVLSGEWDLETLPERQQWLKPLVEERLKTSTEAIDKLVDERLESRLKAKEDDDLFNTLRSKLNSTKLTKAEKDEIETEFKDLKSYLSPGKALEKAIRIAKIDIDVQNVRQAMAIPKAGRQESSKQASIMELDNVDARIAYYEKLRQGR